MNWGNILERAAWTFVQAFVSGFALTSGISDLETLTAAAYSALFAGLSGVLSFIKTVAQEHLATSARTEDLLNRGE